MIQLPDMSNEVQAALLGAFVGALVAGAISYCVGIRLAAKQFQQALQVTNHEHFLHAKSRLRATFAEAVAHLKFGATSATEIFQSSAPKLAASIEEFLPFVCAKSRPQYQNLADSLLRQNVVSQYLNQLTHEQLLNQITQLLTFIEQLPLPPKAIPINQNT